MLLGAAGLAVAAPVAAAAPLATARTLAAATPARPRPTVPRTMANRRPGLPSGSRVRGVEFPLTHLALAHLGTAAGVRLRTRAGWGEWRTVTGCGGTALVPAGGVLAYEVRTSHGGTVTALELNTVDGPRAVVAAAAPAAIAAAPTLPRAGTGTRTSLPIRRRPDWGADESLRYDAGELVWPPEFAPVQTLTVHHTGFDDTRTDPAATVRAIYHAQAIGEGWGDVGYHLLIDSGGKVYEGTYSDPDRAPVLGPTLRPDGRPTAVIGAHVVRFNGGNVGVCLLGDFSKRKPTAAARHALTVVLAALARAARINPTATTNYVNPANGNTATLRTIVGHRNWHSANPDAGATECPGNSFYPLLAGIRTEAGRLVRYAPGTVRWPAVG
jgi:hypothetical protein